MSLKRWGNVLTACAILLLTACDVVSLDANGNPILPKAADSTPGYDNMTPKQIAQQTWQSRVVEAAQNKAMDTSTFLSSLSASPGNQQSFFLRITGPVTDEDAQNEREKKITIMVDSHPLTVQIGPVIRGNSIRDAAGFQFEDFTNQVQFAQLSKAYNREAASHLPKVDTAWMGKQVNALLAVTTAHGKVTDAVALTLTEEAAQ